MSRSVGERGLPAPLVVVAAVVAVYAWALGRGFTSEDFLLLRVLGERPPWRDLAAAFTEPWLGITVVGFYRPLATLVLAAERALFGGRPGGYLAVHVALHALNAVLVLWLARRVLGGGPAAAGSGGPADGGPASRSTAAGSSGRPVEAGPESPVAVAPATAGPIPASPAPSAGPRPSLLRLVPTGSPAPLAAALLFALYPLHPNAVVWVASYATLFAATAVLGCVLAYRRAREQGGWGWWFGALALFAVALGCYEAAVVLPLVLAASDLLAPGVLWPGSRERPDRATEAEAASPVTPGWLVVLPFFALAVVYLLLRRLVFGEVMAGYDAFGARLLAPAPGRLVSDLALSVLRFHLPVYARPAGAVACWAAVVLLVAAPLAWLTLSASRRRRAAAGGAWLFGWLWALAFMAPYAFQPAVPGNGRYWYLPAAGLAIALAALAAEVATALAQRSAAPAGAARRGLRLPALPWVALGLLGLLWTGLLGANLRISLRAGNEARAVQQGLAGLLRGGGRPARLFVAGHPDFVRNRAGVPLAQVLRYGLSDSLRPPFLDQGVARGVPVYPLPPLAGRRLPPPGPELARSRFVVWDVAAGRPEPLRPATGPAGLPTELGGDLAILYRPRPGSRHRLVVLTEGNPTEVELPPGADASGWARAELPRRFVESMDRLYGSEVFWWIEAVGLRDEVTATSALHRLDAR